MTFDWITWSIWLVGFAIMIVWILAPIREFKRLLANKRAELHARGDSLPDSGARRNAE